MKEFKYVVTDPEGLHARPAGILVKKAAEFQSKIMIDKAGKAADAKRILGVMGLGVERKVKKWPSQQKEKMKRQQSLLWKHSSKKICKTYSIGKFICEME